MTLPLAILLLIMSGPLLSAPRRSSGVSEPSRIGPDAVWRPDAAFLKRFHQSCDALSGPQFGECFVREMQKSGASPAAVTFARYTENQGYLTAFRETGRVDVAWAEYPYRANESQLCFLVNGSPPMIDVDDPRILERRELASRPVYAGIAGKYPNVAIFPGPRTGADSVRVMSRPHGGLRFEVSYSLHDGCHACATVGSARFGFDFDADGRFVKTHVVAVEATSP
ncbi:MAG TPA: hypothetical protein VGL03_03655 [Thermoanaerobaculia bacterium]